MLHTENTVQVLGKGLKFSHQKKTLECPCLSLPFPFPELTQLYREYMCVSGWAQSAHPPGSDCEHDPACQNQLDASAMQLPAASCHLHHIAVLSNSIEQQVVTQLTEMEPERSLPFVHHSGLPRQYQASHFGVHNIRNQVLDMYV